MNINKEFSLRSINQKLFFETLLEYGTNEDADRIKYIYLNTLADKLTRDTKIDFSVGYYNGEDCIESMYPIGREYIHIYLEDIKTYKGLLSYVERQKFK